MHWEELKDKVLDRDDWSCQRCGEDRTSVTVHHIRPRDNGGSDDLTNLITLCAKCHDYVELHLKNEPILRTKQGILNSYPYLTQRKDPMDMLLRPAVGERLLGDTRDIWLSWVKQGRKGAKELIELYGGGSRIEVQK